MCVGARALRARSAALSKVIVRTEQNNFAGGGAVAGLVLRARIISLPTYSTAEMVRNPPRRILKPYWKTNFFRPRNGIHPPRTIFRAN